MKQKLLEFKFKRLGIAMVFLLLSLNIFSQTITGIVTSAEDGMGLPGVNVAIKGSTNGSMTDLDGKYTINVNNPQDILVFSFVGMETQEVLVGSQTAINVALKSSEQFVNEVVVVGYGKLNVKDLTSSITTLKSGEISAIPSGQAMQALQGKISGVQVIGNGAPGNSPTIRIRGLGSYADADQNPLFVVDGMFYDNIDFLNPSDIATISVLKDASASAIYGVRAANGVVLIETKSGTYNQKSKITYDGYFGTQVAQNVLKMANAEQFTTMAMESGSAADISFIGNAMQRYGRSRINPNVPDVNTDWYKEILRTAPIQNHSLSIDGGGQNASYSIGASYFAQEGILAMKNDYERFNLRSKLDYKANNWLTVGTNTVWSNATKYSEQASAWNEAYFAIPIMPVYDELNTNATPTKYSSAEYLGYRDGKNPFPTMDFNENRLKIMKLLTTFYANIDIIPNKLSFKTTYSYSLEQLNNRIVGLPYFVSPVLKRDDSYLSKSSALGTRNYWDNVLTYTDKFGKHDLTVMLGTSYRDEAGENLYAAANKIDSQDERLWYINQVGEANVLTSGVGDGGYREYGFSYFGRVSYNYDNKYLVYGTLRADGTSKYQEKWGYFPSVGVGWVISEESFLKNISQINFLKLRASWGRLGNDKVDASDGATTTTAVNTAINGQLVSGAVTTSTFTWLGWEVIEESNFGITSKLINSHLSVDADYYIRDTKNAVIPIQYPFGLGSTRKNAGQIRNSGFELALNWNNNITNDLSYNVGLNLSTLKNEVRDLYGQPYIDGGSAEFRQRSIVGDPLMAFYGLEVAGVYQNDAEIAADPVAVANDLVPGDFKYKDQDNNGIIDGSDRVVLGSYFPSFTYGFNLGVNWKNFEFSANLMGQKGNKILNRKRGEMIWTNDGNLDADLAINRWHGEGTSNSYPSSAGLRKGWNQKMSSYFVEDGSFFRIQNVQLAYNIKGKKMFGAPIPAIRISMTAARPLTLFKYNGFNPEIANGIDTQTYPIPAVYTFGLNVSF